jgi:hypothetical protein
MDEHSFLIICLFYELRTKTQNYSVRINELPGTTKNWNNRKQDKVLYPKEGPSFLRYFQLLPFWILLKSQYNSFLCVCVCVCVCLHDKSEFSLLVRRQQTILTSEDVDVSFVSNGPFKPPFRAEEITVEVFRVQPQKRSDKSKMVKLSLL